MAAEFGSICSWHDWHVSVVFGQIQQTAHTRNHTKFSRLPDTKSDTHRTGTVNVQTSSRLEAEPCSSANFTASLKPLPARRQIELIRYSELLCFTCGIVYGFLYGICAILMPQVSKYCKKYRKKSSCQGKDKTFGDDCRHLKIAKKQPLQTVKVEQRLLKIYHGGRKVRRTTFLIC